MVRKNSRLNLTILLGALLSSSALHAAAPSNRSFYSHELNTAIEYTASSGSSTSGSTSSDTTASKQSQINLQLAYGYIMANFVEPIFEARYNITSNSLGKFSGEITKSEFGLGVLFNVPVFSKRSRPADTSTEEDSDSPPPASTKPPYRWLPFGGVIMSLVGSSQGNSEDGNAKLTNSELVTKLVFGSRYMLYPHLAASTSFRVFYQTNKAAQTTETGDSSSNESTKLTLEFRALSFSLLF